jgi:hypothetical protein
MSHMNGDADNEAEDAIAAKGDDVSAGSKWPEDPDDNVSRLYQSYQSWTYSYMGSILKKGSKQTKTGDRSEKLSQQDLFPVPQKMQSSYLSAQFKKYFHQDGGLIADESITIGTTKRRLLLTLWHLAAPTFVPAGFCELLTVLCQIALPLLVRELLQVLEENPNSQTIVAGMPCELFSSLYLLF